MVASSTGWNDKTTLMVFHSGLQANVQTKLACCNEDLTLDLLISMSLGLYWHVVANPGSSGLSQELPARLRPWSWAQRTFPPRNVNAAINRVSVPTSASRTSPVAHVPEGEPGEEATG